MDEFSVCCFASISRISYPDKTETATIYLFRQLPAEIKRHSRHHFCIQIRNLREILEKFPKRAIKQKSAAKVMSGAALQPGKDLAVSPLMSP